MAKLNFERIECNLAGTVWRAEVPGGWLVTSVDEVASTVNDMSLQYGYEWRSSIAFVPDQLHLWGIC